MASSNDWSVRQAVAWHDSTPDDVLKILADDDDSDVSNATRDRDLPKSWRFMDLESKIEALKSDDVPPQIIEILSSSEDWRLRQAVAWSPSTPESTLEILREDEDDDIREVSKIFGVKRDVSDNFKDIVSNLFLKFTNLIKKKTEKINA